MARDFIEYRLVYFSDTQGAAENFYISGLKGIGCCEPNFSYWYNGRRAPIGTPGAFYLDSRACIGSARLLTLRPPSMKTLDNLVIYSHWYSDSFDDVFIPQGSHPQTPTGYFRLVPKVVSNIGFTGSFYHHGGDYWHGVPYYRVTGAEIAASVRTSGSFTAHNVTMDLWVYRTTGSNTWWLCDAAPMSKAPPSAATANAGNFWYYLDVAGVVYPSQTDFTMFVNAGGYPYTTAGMALSSVTAPGFMVFPRYLTVTSVTGVGMRYVADRYHGASYGMAPAPRWLGNPSTNYGTWP